MRYRGYYFDTETSLYYLQSRYYDPETCRFINADSLLVAGDYLQGTNLFAYCVNNPVMYSDHAGNVTGDYSSPSEQVARNVSTIVACLAYIVDYAERNGKNYYAVVDFLNRTTNEKSELVNYAEVLTVGIYVLAGEDWLGTLLSIKGIKGDFSDISSAASGTKPKVDSTLTVIDAAASIIRDFFNPLMFDDDVRLNAPVHIANAAAGMGIGAFSVELAAAVSAATGGNVAAGIVVGTIFYMIANYGWNSISN